MTKTSTPAQQAIADRYAQKATKKLQTAFAQLRHTAESTEHIATWLSEHGALLAEVTKATSKNMPSLTRSEPRKTIRDVAFMTAHGTMGDHNITMRPIGHRNYAYYRRACLRGRLKITFTPDIDIASIFKLADVGLNLTTFEKNSGGIWPRVATDRYEYTLFAEDWPFVSASFLHHYAQACIGNIQAIDFDPRIPNAKEAAPLLQACFPTLPWSVFEQLCQAGLYADDTSAFYRQLRDYQPTAIIATTVPALPMDLCDS